MEDKIKEYFLLNRLGTIEDIKEQGKWAYGKLYHIKVKRIFKPTEYTVYEFNNNIKTVKSLQTNKKY